MFRTAERRLTPKAQNSSNQCDISHIACARLRKLVACLHGYHKQADILTLFSHCVYSSRQLNVLVTCVYLPHTDAWQNALPAPIRWEMWPRYAIAEQKCRCPKDRSPWHFEACYAFPHTVTQVAQFRQRAACWYTARRRRYTCSSGQQGPARRPRTTRLYGGHCDTAPHQQAPAPPLQKRPRSGHTGSETKKPLHF